jgi:hypothetical protein
VADDGLLNLDRRQGGGQQQQQQQQQCSLETVSRGPGELVSSRDYCRRAVVKWLSAA